MYENKGDKAIIYIVLMLHYLQYYIVP